MEFRTLIRSNIRDSTDKVPGGSAVIDAITAMLGRTWQFRTVSNTSVRARGENWRNLN